MKETFLKTVMEGAGIGRKKAEYLWQIGVRLPAEQHKGEPVALPERKEIPTPSGAYEFRKGWNSCLDEIAKLGPLYTRPAQGEPVKAIPLKDCVPGWHSDYNDGLFATSDAVVTLYTHADPGEVERLREQIKEWQETSVHWMHKCDTLRTQLAELEKQRIRLRDNNVEASKENMGLQQKLDERDALLARVVNSGVLACYRYEELEADCCAALSASAEPSAPECKACHGQGEVFVRKGDVHYGMQTEPEPIMAACPECAEPSAPDCDHCAGAGHDYYGEKCAHCKPSAPKCNYCGDTGQIMVGRSGDANDGNAPIMEPCEDCERGAPVERDERAEFEAFFEEKAKTLPLLRGATTIRYAGGQYVNDWALFGNIVWQARAALERKS